MTQFLVDVNVWLAILRSEHLHHRIARHWSDQLLPGQACLCRIVQLSIVRLLGNRTILGAGAMPAAEAWRLTGELLEDERVVFVAEPADLETVLPTLFRYAVPTQGLFNDAYLAAFAIASSRRLVTLDRGFEQFRGLDVEVLA